MSLSPLSNSHYPPCHSSSSSSNPPIWLSPQKQKILKKPLPTSPSKISNLSTLPNWYAYTHRLLVKLTSYNREEPIDPLDCEEIRKTAHFVKETGDEMQALLFMKLLSEFSLYGSQEIFFEILKSLRSRHPDLNIYFKDLDLDEDGIYPSFSIRAIEQILRFFSSEYHFPLETWSMAEASSFPDQVYEMILNAPDKSIQAWAVSNDLRDGDPHVIPVFALKTSDVVHLFFFDSIGHTIPGSSDAWRLGMPLLEVLNQLRNMQFAYDRLQIYSYGPARQFSPAGCVTFTLLDLKNLIEMHLKGSENLIEFYQDQPPNLQPTLVNDRLKEPFPFPVFEIMTLPPQMMKSTQSYTELQKYENQLPTIYSFPITNRTSSSGEIYSKPLDFEDFRHRVAASKRIDEKNKCKNLYVEQKMMQFTIYLLGTYFGVSILSPEAICTPKTARRSLTFDS